MGLCVFIQDICEWSKLYIIKDYRTGMNEQLTKFAYKNTAIDDLWESLSAGSGKPVVMVMSK